MTPSPVLTIHAYTPADFWTDDGHTVRERLKVTRVTPRKGTPSLHVRHPREIWGDSGSWPITRSEAAAWLRAHRDALPPRTPSPFIRVERVAIPV